MEGRYRFTRSEVLVFVVVCVLVCMLGCSRETELIRYTWVDFKELAHVIMEAGKSKICREGQQAREPGKSQCQSSSPKAAY